MTPLDLAVCQPPSACSQKFFGCSCEVVPVRAGVPGDVLAADAAFLGFSGACAFPATPQFCSWPANPTHETGRMCHMNTTSPNSFVRLPQVLKETGLSRATLYRKVQDGTFPKQSRIATRCVGWRRSALDQWLQNPMFYSVDDFT